MLVTNAALSNLKFFHCGCHVKDNRLYYPNMQTLLYKLDENLLLAH